MRAIVHTKESIKKYISIEFNGCWRWTGRLTSCGYGQVTTDGKRVQAHRAVYQIWGNEIPSGLELDHLCNNRWCVNPAHLEPVTHKENMRRSPHKGSKTHCKHGHEYTPENTYIVPGRPRRMCQECQAIRKGTLVRRGPNCRTARRLHYEQLSENAKDSQEPDSVN